MHCPRCGTRMAINDRTTKLTEYACNGCQWTEIESKQPVAGRRL